MLWNEPGFVRSSQLELGHPATDASNFCEQGVRSAVLDRGGTGRRSNNGGCEHKPNYMRTGGSEIGRFSTGTGTTCTFGTGTVYTPLVGICGAESFDDNSSYRGVRKNSKQATTVVQRPAGQA